MVRDCSSLWQWGGAHPSGRVGYGGGKKSRSKGGGGALVWGQRCRKLYNYHKSLLHYRFFPSPSISHFPHPHTRALPLSLFLSVPQGCASSSSHLHSHPDGPPGFPPFILLSVPGDVLYSKHCWLLSLPHSLSVSASFTLWFVYMLSLLICFLLPSRDLSPVHGTVLVNLEIDLSLWDGSDIVCSWNKRKCHLVCSLFHILSDSTVTGFLVASLLGIFSK